MHELESNECLKTNILNTSIHLVPKMATKLGEDWVFIGLGLGAVYLVYKLTKPVTELVDTASNITTDALTSADSVVRDAGNTLFQKATGTENPTTAMGWLTASVPTLINKASQALSTASASMFNKPSSGSSARNYTPVIDPKKTQFLTNVAASQGRVSVAPPQMSLSPQAKISPFTGKPFLSR